MNMLSFFLCVCAAAVIVWLGVTVRAQAPTITIPPGWRGYVCAAYANQQARCKTADEVRAFLGR